MFTIKKAVQAIMVMALMSSSSIYAESTKHSTKKLDRSILDTRLQDRPFVAPNVDVNVDREMLSSMLPPASVRFQSSLNGLKWVGVTRGTLQLGGGNPADFIIEEQPDGSVLLYSATYGKYVKVDSTRSYRLRLGASKNILGLLRFDGDNFDIKPYKFRIEDNNRDAGVHGFRRSLNVKLKSVGTGCLVDVDRTSFNVLSASDSRSNGLAGCNSSLNSFTILPTDNREIEVSLEPAPEYSGDNDRYRMKVKNISGEPISGVFYELFAAKKGSNGHYSGWDVDLSQGCKVGAYQPLAPRDTFDCPGFRVLDRYLDGPFIIYRDDMKKVVVYGDRLRDIIK